MQQHKNNNGFFERLADCVVRVGGKRAMANMALISEAQLFRYINADTDLPREKLVAIAKAAGVDAGWLLTGKGPENGPDGADIRPSFRSELMVQVVQTFEELLFESNKSFTPRQRALAMTLIYEALRFEEVRTGVDINVDKRMTPYYPDFLAPLRSDSRMEDYLNTMKALEFRQDVSTQSLKQFDALIKLGLISAYEGAMGEIYFEKMGSNLLPDAAKTLFQLVEQVMSLTGKDRLHWLDAGCGNGRHLSFLSQHCPQLVLHGFDLSQLALGLCDKMVRSGKLPIGIVQEGDLRAIPHPQDSIDVVYCRAGLHMLPYLPGTQIGATQFMSEIARVLSPGGVAFLLTPEGLSRDYINFIQYHTMDSIHALAKEAGLKVISIGLTDINETGGTAGKDYSAKLNRALQVLLQKPA